MKKIIIVTETRSDITKELADQLGVVLVPMHVSMGDTTLDDGAFPPEDICDYYDQTGKLPTTSGCTIYDFESVFNRIFEEDSDSLILHLAYSAQTTCSYHSAILAAEDKLYKNNIRSIDTKQVSVGQFAVITAVATWLKHNPEATLDEAAVAAEKISKQIKMCFVPQDLNYLRAGGRCSNTAALVGNILNLHPCVEVVDGKLIAVKKYRGRMSRIAHTVLCDFSNKYNPQRDHIYFINTPYMDETVRTALEEEARIIGYKEITWVKTGCVITCHGGPGAFGIVGILNE